MQSAPEGAEGSEDITFVGTLADIQAVIESAKARGGIETVERHIAKTLPESDEAEVREAAEVAVEIVDSIPVFLARARQEAESRSLTSVIGPLLDRAEQYFLQPMDLIPEMTQGLAGLLDDAYLVVRILQSLEKGPEPFLDWDLDYPAKFLRTVVGEAVAQRLDVLAFEALQDVSTQLAEVWAKMSHPA